MVKRHNDIWCEDYYSKVLPNEEGKCSLCNAVLHDLTLLEAKELVGMLETVAIERMTEEKWRAEDWLTADEANALQEAKGVDTIIYPSDY